MYTWPVKHLSLTTAAFYQHCINSVQTGLTMLYSQTDQLGKGKI